MTFGPRDFVVYFLALFSGCALAVEGTAAADPHLTPLAADVLSAPIPVLGSDGRRHFVYELRLSNTAGGDAELKKIEVVDQATGKILLVLDRTEIAQRFLLGGQRGAESANLGAAQFGFLFLHVALDAADPVPGALTHRIAGYFTRPGIDLTLTVGDVVVTDRHPVALGPPLIGTGYVAGDGCCDSIRHVRAL